MKRNKRAHGRILSVETMQRGSALAVDAAAAATSITVDDAGDFDEDGGWLYIGAQVVEFTACDDDTGVITLATGLTVLAEQGDPVHVYDPLYGEVVDYQVALVQLDGEHDNPDPVEAEVAEGVEDLPEGDRGKAGESCTLLRIADDEWELVAVGGRPRSSRGVRFYEDSTTVTDLGDQAIALTYTPVDHSGHLYWNGNYQPQSEWTRNVDFVEIPDPDGVIQVGDELVLEYAILSTITTVAAEDAPVDPEDPVPPGAACPNGDPVSVTWTRFTSETGTVYIQPTITFAPGYNAGSSWKVYLVVDEGSGPVWAHDKNVIMASGGTLYVNNFTNHTTVVGFGFFIRNSVNEPSSFGKWKQVPPSGGAPNPADYFMGLTDPSLCRFYFGTKIADLPAPDARDEPAGPISGP